MTPAQEEKLGQAMWEFEREQCVRGRRPPLPKTPVMSRVTTKAEARAEIVNSILPIYKTITPELMDILIPYRVTDRLIRIFMNAWEEMKDESISSL
jgi:hypothetical protein